jgi:hypothetical protein
MVTPWKTVRKANFDIENCVIALTDQNNYTQYIYSVPIGWWTDLLFNKSFENVDQYKFMDTMMMKTDDVVRRMARLRLDQFLWETSLDYQGLIKVMNAMVLLDPTFNPPWINRRSKWQRELLHHIVYTESYRLVDTAQMNHRRFERFNDALHLSS